MKLQIEDLGKVSITVEAEFWDKTRAYPKLTIVSVEDAYSTFISRKPVPSNTELTNRQYWIPFSNLKEEIVLNYNAFKAYVMEQLAQQQVYIDGKFAIERERIDELFANKSAEIDLHIQELDRIVEQQSARLDAQDRDIQAISDRVTTVEAKVDNISTQMILPLIEEILSTRPIVQDANYVHTDNNYTTSEKNKLGALPTDTQLANLYLKKADAQELYQPKGTYLTPGDVDGNPTSGHANPVSSGGVKSALDGINGKIPSEASSSNQLADKEFVNSSIATSTATYRGTYNLVSDLGEPITATNTEIGTALDTTIQIRDKNDYCFVQIPVSAESLTTIAQIRRFKFNGTNWLFEYVLNNSGFTQAQWDAINSYITSALVIKLQNLPTYAELLTLLGTLLPKTEAAATYQPIGDYATNTELNALSGELDEAELDIEQNADDIRQIKNALINIQIAGIVILRKTYAELKELRDNNGLIEGCYYRITDYVTTVGSQITNARSAGHRFDLVVLATSSNTIAEEAQAVKHEYPSDYIPADTSAPDYQEKYDEVHYWDKVPIELWKIDYCLDNNTDKFKWACNADYTFINITSDPVPYNPHLIRYAAGDAEGADYPYCWGDSYFHVYTASETPAVGDTAYGASDGTGNSYTLSVVREVAGKGVIYHMIDENNNDIPYDFKNIQFKRPVNAGRAGLLVKDYTGEQTIGSGVASRAMKTLASIFGAAESRNNASFYVSQGVGDAVIGSTLTDSYIDWEGNMVIISASAEYLPFAILSSDTDYIYILIDRYKWVYTFDAGTYGDMSCRYNSSGKFTGQTHDNLISPYHNKDNTNQKLNNIVVAFFNVTAPRGVIDCTFGAMCYNITLGQASTGFNIEYNFFNCTFGKVNNSSFDGNSGSLLIGSLSGTYLGVNSMRCIIGNNFNYNTIVTCQNFFVGNNFRNNTIGGNSMNIVVGDNFDSNTLGSSVQHLFFGDNIKRNVFESEVGAIVYGNDINNPLSNFSQNTIKSNWGLRILCDVPTAPDSKSQPQYITFDAGLNYSSINNMLELHIDEAGQNYSIFYKNEDQRVIPVNNTTVGEIRIDQSGTISDPDGMISVRNIQYFENIRSMCRLVSWDGTLDANNEPVLKEVSREDKGLYADGTTRDVTEDLFVEIPRLWYKGVESGSANSDIWTVYIQMDRDHDANDATYHLFEKRLVGAYKGRVVNNKLRSYTDVTPHAAISQTEFKTYARNQGSGFSIVDYDTHKLVALLFYGLYNSTDSQSKCGSGGSSQKKTTGYSNALGMTDTNVITGNGAATTGFTNFLGIENWWGDTAEFMDDLVSADVNGTVNIVDKSDGTTVVRSVSCATTDSNLCISKMKMGEYADILPKANDETDFTVYYADSGRVSPTAGNIGIRSNTGNGERGGVNYIAINNDSSYTASAVGARLIYVYPTPAPAGE